MAMLSMTPMKLLALFLQSLNHPMLFRDSKSVAVTHCIAALLAGCITMVCGSFSACQFEILTVIFV